MRAFRNFTLLLIFLGTHCTALADLITNGSFEGGNLGFSTSIPDWVVSPSAQGFTGGECGSSFYVAHTGSCAAWFSGSTAQLADTISQTLATSPGTLYSLQFYVWSDTTTNELIAAWGETTVFDQVNIPVQNYTPVSLNVTATGASTVLQFSGRSLDAVLVDDVSVNPLPTPLPEPSSLTLIVSIFIIFGGFFGVRKVVVRHYCVLS
jgi:hypothetical protein